MADQQMKGVGAYTNMADRRQGQNIGSEAARTEIMKSSWKKQKW